MNDHIRNAFVKKQESLIQEKLKINDDYVAILLNTMEGFISGTKALYKHEIYDGCKDYLGDNCHYVGDNCRIYTYMTTEEFTMKIEPANNSNNMFNSGLFDESYVKEALELYNVSLSISWDESHTDAIAELIYRHNTKKNQKKR